MFYFFAADAAPLAVPGNDTTPLHTPTLLPMSPQPTTAHPAPAQHAPAPQGVRAPVQATQAPGTERSTHYSKSFINTHVRNTLRHRVTSL